MLIYFYVCTISGRMHCIAIETLGKQGLHVIYRKCFQRGGISPWQVQIQNDRKLELSYTHNKAYRCHIVLTNSSIKHQALLLLKLQNSFFHSSLGNESHSTNGTVLAKTMSAVNGLHLCCWIPPRIKLFAAIN